MLACSELKIGLFSFFSGWNSDMIRNRVFLRCVDHFRWVLEREVINSVVEILFSHAVFLSWVMVSRCSFSELERCIPKNNSCFFMGAASASFGGLCFIIVAHVLLNSHLENQWQSTHMTYSSWCPLLCKCRSSQKPANVVCILESISCWWKPLDNKANEASYYSQSGQPPCTMYPRLGGVWDRQLSQVRKYVHASTILGS